MAITTDTVATARATFYTSPDPTLFGLSGAFDTINLPAGNFISTPPGVGSVGTISMGFPSIGSIITGLNSVKLKYNANVVGAVAALSILVSYNGGTTYAELDLVDSTTGFITREFTLSTVDPADITIAAVFTANVGGETATITNLQIEYVYSTAIRFNLLSDLALELIEEYGDRSNSIKKVPVVQRWLNRVYQKIISFANWSWARSNEAITTEADVDTYRLTSPSMQITSLNFADTGEKIHFRGRDYLNRDEFNLSNTGKPRFFYTEGLDNGSINLVLVPTPDSAYDISAYGNPLPFELDASSEVPLPATMIPVLLDGARYYYSQSDGHPEDAQMHLGNFMQGLKQMRSRYLQEPADDSTAEDINSRRRPYTSDGYWGQYFPI